jgi:DNA primase catalytic subunit
VVFLVEKDVRVERRCTCDYLNHEEINRQYEVRTRSYQKNRNKEVGRSVAFVTEVRQRDKMGGGIMGVMEVDVVAKKPTAHWMVGDLIMYHGLPK